MKLMLRFFLLGIILIALLAIAAFVALLSPDPVKLTRTGRRVRERAAVAEAKADIPPDDKDRRREAEQVLKQYLRDVDKLDQEDEMKRKRKRRKERLLKDQPGLMNPSKNRKGDKEFLARHKQRLGKVRPRIIFLRFLSNGSKVSTWKVQGRRKAI